LELEDMVKKYIEEEKPQNMTDPRLEPRIPGVDYDKWSAPAPGTEAAKNEPISNWESKFAGKTVGHGAPASYSQLIGIILATCLASAVTLGLAKPGFDQYIMEPLFDNNSNDVFIQISSCSKDSTLTPASSPQQYHQLSLTMCIPHSFLLCHSRQQ